MKSLYHNHELKRNTHKPFICIMATYDCYLTKTISFSRQDHAGRRP